MTIDAELLAELRVFVAAQATVRELGFEESQAFLDRLSATLVRQPHSIWWWSELAVKSVGVPYGELSDGLELVERLMDGKDDVLLAITDDESPPWPVFEGPVSSLCAMLREVRICEYFMADRGARWTLFDTHHNCIVVVGELIDHIPADLVHRGARSNL